MLGSRIHTLETVSPTRTSFPVKMPGGVALFKLPAALLGLSSLVKRQPIGSRESALDLETAHPYETRDTEPDLGTVLSENGNITTYYNLIKTYPDILLQLPSYAGVTIVAPSDDAFKKYQDWNSNNQTVVTSILQYHILQSTIPMSGIPEGPSTFAPTLLTNQAYTNVTGGQNVIINNQGGDTIVFTSGGGSRSTLLYGDIPFSGGLLQIVDTLFVPPPRLEPTARDDYTDLTAFLAALYAANLIPVFASSPNVTIFAPRTAAFQQLAGTLEGLSQAELARILSYHLVPGQVIPSSHLTNNTNLTTAAPGGEKVHIIRSGNNMYVDAAQIVQPDILIANGVVHMIDNVLNPDSAATPTPSLATQPPVFPLTGPTKTGTSVPTPFTSALPCTSDCPVTTSSANATATTTTTTGGVLRGTSQGAAAGARCTVLAGLGVGWGAAVVGFLGIV